MTVLCIWAEAIVVFGIIYVCYKRFFEPTEETEEDLEAGGASNETFEECFKEKGFLEGGTLKESSTLIWQYLPAQSVKMQIPVEIEIQKY